MSIGDGPGIRSTVFFKGCHFRCAWCHNPETWSPEAQLQHIPDLCIACHSCVDACPIGALTALDGNISLDRRLCKSCGACSLKCPSGALSMTGRHVLVEDVMKEIAMDIPYYIESGGGVTLSGGEPLLQYDFVRELLSQCKESNIHTAIETTLDIEQEKLDLLIPLIDLWMVDVKTMDDKAHEIYTGGSNKKTLENLYHLATKTKAIIARTPVIPGVNDDSNSIERICKYLISIGIENYELLPFHNLGFDKYMRYGIKNRMIGREPLSKSEILRLKSIIERYGF